MTNTVIINLSGTTQPKPIFSPASELKGLVFLNNTGELDFNTTGYGYAILNITYSGSANFAGVSFGTNGSTFSISRTGMDGLFYDFPDGTLDEFYITLQNGVTKSIYVILNGDTITNSLKILCSAGFTVGQAISSGTVTVVYECPLVPLFKYNMGLHVYSAYDSIFTPKLTTNIYSNDNISGWTINTRLWMTSTLSMPALQYYYSSGDTVYKVGGAFKREYGVKYKYNLITNNWRSLWGKSPKITKEQIGPASFYNQDDTIDACVNVITTDAGIITEVIDKSILTSFQPTKYKYYMGYDTYNKQLSNDNFFVKYVFSQTKYYAITGLQHVANRLISGYIKSLKINYNSEDIIPDPDGEYSSLIIAGITLGVAVAAYLLKKMLSKLIYKIGFKLASWNILLGTNPGWAIAKQLIGKILTSSVVPWIGTAIALIGLAYNLFRNRRSTLQELCTKFLIEYTTTPYIELLSSLSRTQNMANINDGYFCDGAYFYTQSGGLITGKELSSTNALTNEDPLTLTLTSSITPDNPTHVTYLPSLFLLPYVSGIPIEFGAAPVYYSAAITISISANDCAELVLSNDSSFTLPYGFIISTISQSDADNKAAAAAASQSLIINSYDYSKLLNEENLGMVDSYFTHEIRVETTPMPVNIFYDNTNQLGLTIGKKAFYDEMGRYEVMNGYYAITGTTIFRTFYKFNNGYVVDIYNMQTSSSTTVTGNSNTIPVITINLNYTSNWFFTSQLEQFLVTKVNNILRNRCFDPNTLYSDTSLVRGYYRSGTTDNLLLYNDNFSSITMTEASAGYYQPINEWLGDPIIEYSPSLNIAIYVEEICLPLTSYNNALYGFYIKGNVNGFTSPLYTTVNLTVDVYVNNTGTADVLTATYNVVTNSATTKTYVSYNNLISITDNVTLIDIRTIDSTNPIGKITYIIGDFINCGTILLTYVTTNNINYINSTTISTGGSVFNTKGIVQEYGVVISNTPGPTIYNTYEIQGTNHSGDFNWNSTLTYIFSTNTYYLKAVAKINGVYYYGNEKTINTLQIKPIVNTLNAPLYDITIANVTGQLISSGNSSITSSGVCWSYNYPPTTGDTIDYTNYQSGVYFVSSITGFTINTIIYARAFAINGAGAGYGDIIHFMPNDYVIGSHAEGGIIAFIEYDTDSTVPHGLIAREYDLPSTYIWGCGFRTYASSFYYKGGRYNTQQIMSRCSQSNTAAKVCSELNENDYYDWFLPSPEELGLLHMNLREQGIGNMSQTAAYWSSREDHDAWYNWDIAYYKGGVMNGYSSKAQAYKVRPCRYF